MQVPKKMQWTSVVLAGRRKRVTDKTDRRTRYEIIGRNSLYFDALDAASHDKTLADTILFLISCKPMRYWLWIHGTNIQMQHIPNDTAYLIDPLAFRAFDPQIWSSTTHCLIYSLSGSLVIVHHTQLISRLHQERQGKGKQIEKFMCRRQFSRVKSHAVRYNCCDVLALERGTWNSNSSVSFWNIWTPMKNETPYIAVIAELITSGCMNTLLTTIHNNWLYM